MLKLESLDHISEQPWVYIFRDSKKNIIYVGKAKNLKKRLAQYFAAWSLWKQDMIHKADDVEFLVCQSEQEALILESNLIKQHFPVYNRLLKWDNSYVYIKITNHKRPQILLTRHRIDDGAIYIWPKNNSMELRKLLQRMRQFLQYRWCKDKQFNQGELCNDYIFWLCKGWCVYAKIEENTIIQNSKFKTLPTGRQIQNSTNKLSTKKEKNLEDILEKASRLWFKA